MKKVLRCIGLMLVMMLLLSGYSCEGGEDITEEEPVARETQALSVQVSDPELQKLIEEVEREKGQYWTTKEAETHEIINICVKSVPTTSHYGCVSIKNTIYCNFVSFCYESNDGVEFKTLSTDNANGTYEVYFSIGEENKFCVILGKTQYVENSAVYYITLTQEAYQSIYAQ